jgi:anti-anti-sigma factor
MEITQEKIGTITTVTLKGRMDAGTSKSVEDHLLKLIDGGEHRLVVDFAQLDYISSVGLRVLILASKKVKPLQGSIVVCALQPTIKQVFEVAGFTTIFKVYPTRDDAVAGLG